MKGQLSIEMLVVLVIILGVVALVASTLMDSAKKAQGEVDKRAEATFGTCVENGQPCSANADCCSSNCVEGACTAPLG